MDDLISVIVPVYKVEKYLNRCVDSIINQTYKNLEIILVDDGSPDNCPKICDEYAMKDNRIKVIHKENGGLSDARNEGIKIAKGNYIGFVDSDDWIHKSMFENLYSAMANSKADIATCEFIRTKDKIQKNDYNNFFDNSITEYNQEQYIKKFFKIGSQECVYYAWNKLYKRNIIDENQYPKGLTSEDVVGTYKAILKSKKIITINYPYYYYYYNLESITSVKFSKKDLDLIPIWDKIIEITKTENIEYLWMAELNRYRIDYTLLMRMAIQLDFKQIQKLYFKEYTQMLEELKKHKKELLKAQIPLSRKVTIALICINYKMFVKIFNIKHRRK